MENYQDIISRLGQHLAEIEANTSKPLADVANKYRLTAEAICKAIIVGHGAQPQGLLERLIADALKWVEADESVRDAAVIAMEERRLISPQFEKIESYDAARQLRLAQAFMGLQRWRVCHAL